MCQHKVKHLTQVVCFIVCAYMYVPFQYFVANKYMVSVNLVEKNQTKQCIAYMNIPHVNNAHHDLPVDLTSKINRVHPLTMFNVSVKSDSLMKIHK